MPQFDFYTTFVQSFWFILGCIAFYFVYNRYVLPYIGSSLKMRERLNQAFAFALTASVGYYDAVIKFLKKNK